MKFVVCMKDPDTLQDSIKDAVRRHVDSKFSEDLDDAERDDLIEKRSEKIEELCGLWFQFGEVLCVEIDTEAKTCTVRQVKV